VIGFLALLLINAVLFVAEQLLIPPPKIPDATPEDPKGPRSEEGDVIPVVFGTVRLAANVVSFSNTRAVEQKERIKTGLFSSRNVTTGFSYEAIMQVLWCHGPVDELIDLVWQESKSLGESGAHTEYHPVAEIPGAPVVFQPVTVEGTYTTPELPVLNDGNADGTSLTADAPELFGGPKHGGGIVGPFQWYFGNWIQNFSDTLKREWSVVSNDLYGGDFTPKYEGICHSVMGLNVHIDGDVLFPNLIVRFNFGEFGNVPSLHAVVRRCPSVLGVTANINGGANPAEVAYEMLTNTVWGMAVPATFLDTASFAAAGATLAAEGFGINLSMTSQQTGDSFLTELMRYVDGQIQQHPITGLIEFTLNRADYVLADLPVINESAAKGAQYNRPSWADLKNEIKVVYTKVVGGVMRQVPTQPVQDIANQRNFGGVNSETVSYPAITDPVLANKLAVRDLRKTGTPLAQISGLQVDRRAADFRVGRPFVFSWARYGIAQHVFRVARVDYGTLNDGRILVDAIEDIFALEQPFYAQPVDFSIDDPTYGALGIVRVTPIVTSDESTGYLELVLDGGAGRVTSVEFQEATGHGEPTAWHVNTDPDGFKTEVDLDSKYNSHISWRVLGHLKDGTIGNIADGEVEYPYSTLPARPQLSAVVHTSGWADIIADLDQDSRGLKITSSYDHMPTIEEVIASPEIALPPGEFRLTLNHEIFLDAEHPVANFTAVAIGTDGRAGPLATLVVNATRPEQYVTPSPSFGPIEVEATALDGTEEGCMHIPVQFEFNTDVIEIYARESEIDPDAPVGVRPPDLATNSQSYIVRRQEGLITEDDNWRMEVDIATKPGFYRRIIAIGIGPTGLRGNPFHYSAQCEDTGTPPSAPPSGLTVIMSTVAGRARATLTWANGDAAAFTRIERNEVIIARMAPGVGTLVDDGLPPELKVSYRASHILNGQTSNYADSTEGETDVPQLLPPVWETGYPQSAGYDSNVLSPPPNGRVRIKATTPDPLARIFVWMNNQEGGGGTFSLKHIASGGVVDVYLVSNVMGVPNPKDEERSFYLVAIRDGYTDSVPSEVRTATFGFG
jgi:hypothetical protein